MKPYLLSTCLLIMGVGVSVAQQITPVWVEHHNGLVNVDPTNKIPILIRQGATGDEAYADQNSGKIKIEGFCGFVRYDADHYLIGVRENGIDETTETNADKLTIAAQFPDRSVIWIDAHTGKPMGVAAHFPYSPVVNATQAGSDFWWKWGIDEGAYGEKVIYTSFRYKILRWAPTGTVVDAQFPQGRPTWSTTPTLAWVEPVPSEPSPTVPPWDKWITSIHSSPAPADANDTSHLANYIGSSGGDGSASWRMKAFKVSGSGSNTVIWAGGATWRASMLEQEFVSADGGMTYYPIARLNDRGDGYGAKGNYGLGGEPSSIRASADGRKWCIQGHYPGTGWGARPGRYTLNPAATNDDGQLILDTGTLSANDSGTNHHERPHFFDPDNREAGALPAFNWESAGTAGICGPDHHVDGVAYYDGNWVMTTDTKEGVDYIVSYAIPSWDQQFGHVGADWPNSIDPNSIFKPGWIGVHTLDGKIAAGSGNAWKLPCYETDEPIVDPNGNAGTGFDYGYDGDVTVYPDSTAPAGSQRSLVLVSFGEYGFGVFQVENVAVAGTYVNPSSVTTTENHPVSLSGSFVGTGSPVYYEWQKDDGAGNFTTVPNGKGNLAKFGHLQTGFGYSIAQAGLTAAGNYRYIIGNSLGWHTSAVATVTVSADTVAPLAVSAGSADGNTIDIQFNEILDTNSTITLDIFSYTVSDATGPLEVNGVTARDGNTTISLSLAAPATGPFTVSFAGIPDLKGNSSATPQVLQGTPAGFSGVVIGGVSGSTHSTGGTAFELEGNGGGFGGAADSGQFLYKTVTGDFDVQVQITGNQLPANTGGIIARETTNSDSPMVFAGWNPSARYGSFVRPTAGGTAAFFNPELNWVCELSDPPQVWLRLRRQAGQFSAFRSSDGKSWISEGTTSPALANTLLLGLAAASGDPLIPGVTRFNNYGSPVSLSLNRTASGALQLSWNGAGVLEASPTINGGWTSQGVDQTNPQLVPANSVNKFFRLRLP